MQTLWLDIRHALRVMRQSPGSSAVAVISLALAIGVNASVFSLLNAVVLRSLPAPRPEQLVAVETIRPNVAEGPLSFPAFDRLTSRQSVFSSVIGYWGDGIFSVEANGKLTRSDIWAVTTNFYAELGVRPFAGRLLTDADVRLDSRSPAMVAVLGYGIWQREFGGEASVIGSQIRVEGRPFTVIGIAPQGFTGIGVTSEPDVTIPLTAAPLLMPGSADRFTAPTSRWVSVIGRLKDDVSLSDARAQLTVLWDGIREETAPTGGTAKERDDFLATRLRLSSAASGKEWFLRSRFTTPLYIVLGVGGLILLIACVNLASLTLSRAAARAHEVSIRVAIGASRARIARQMVTEGLVVSAFAAAAGLVLAAWSSRALATMMTSEYLVPVALDVSPDGRVLAFTVLIAIAAGALVSAVPAWRMTRQDPAAVLQQHGRALAVSGRAGKALIVVQVALSIVLLMDAGLLVRTLGALRGIDHGFTVDDVMVATLFPQPDGYKNLEHARYYPELMERLEAIPGVRLVAMSRLRPGFADSKQVVAPIESQEGIGTSADFGRVGPGFFELLDVRVQHGREFSWSDTSATPRTAILSRSLAAALFPGADAIGRHIRIGTAASRRDLEVVGLVADAHLFNPRELQTFAVYVPLLQDGDSAQWSDVLMQTAGPAPTDLDVRRAVQSLGRESIQSYRPVQRVLDRAILQERVTAILGGFFGVLALALAAIGLYGLMAFGVARRRKEIAIRVALGSARSDVVRMIVRDALSLVAVGLAIGIPLALISSRVVASLLFGLTPTDPVTLIVTAALLLAIGVIGGYIPGRRASTVDPIDALRT